MVVAIGDINVARLGRGQPAREVQLAGSVSGGAPLEHVCAVSGELLDAIARVRDVDEAVAIYRHPVRPRELPRTSSGCAPGPDEAALRAERLNVGAVTVGDENDTPRPDAQAVVVAELAITVARRAPAR